jgi:hypothetical protein
MDSNRRFRLLKESGRLLSVPLFSVSAGQRRRRNETGREPTSAGSAVGVPRPRPPGLLVRAIPEDDPELRDLLGKFGLLEQFTPYIAGGRGVVRGEETRGWLKAIRTEAIAERTLPVSAVATIVQ